jgi:hypothetical protein
MKSVFRQVAILAVVGFAGLLGIAAANERGTRQIDATEPNLQESGIKEPKIVDLKEFVATVAYTAGSELVLVRPSGESALMKFDEEVPLGALPIVVTCNEQGLVLSHPLTNWGVEGNARNSYPLCKKGESLQLMEKPVTKGDKCLFAVLRRPGGTTEQWGLKVLPKSLAVSGAEQSDAADSR